MSHKSPRSIVAPTIATSEYNTRNGFTAFDLNINSTHLDPYKPQPIMVEKAKQHIATAVKIDTQLPYVVIKPEIVSSAPAASPKAIPVPLQRITSAVTVQITIVSINTSKIPKYPWPTASSVSAHA